jgi:antitoxin CptB
MTETAENLDETEVLRRKLRYRSWHRGTREMDLIMGRFADAHLDSFTHDQLVTYEDLLQENDPDLYNWLTGREAVPAEKNSEIMQLLVKG